MISSTRIINNNDENDDNDNNTNNNSNNNEDVLFQFMRTQYLEFIVNFVVYYFSLWVPIIYSWLWILRYIISDREDPIFRVYCDFCDVLFQFVRTQYLEFIVTFVMYYFSLWEPSIYSWLWILWCIISVCEDPLFIVDCEFWGILFQIVRTQYLEFIVTFVMYYFSSWGPSI